MKKVFENLKTLPSRKFHLGFLLAAVAFASMGATSLALYQHHERSTLATLEADLQNREIGLDPTDRSAVGKFSDGTKFHLVSQEMPNVSLTGTLGVTGAVTLSNNVTMSLIPSGRVPYTTTGGLFTNASTLTYNGTTLAVNNGTYSGTLASTGKITGSDTVAAVLGFRAGNTGASNTILYRSGADMWTTPDSLTVGGYSLFNKVVVGVRSDADTLVGLFVKPTNLLGPQQAGADIKPTCSSAATDCFGVILFPQNAAGAYTITNFWGMDVSSFVKGAGSTITNQYGIEIGNVDQGTNNWALKTGSGMVQLGDSLKVARSVTYTASSTPPLPTSNGAIRQYQKGSIMVFQYNDAGTVRYKYLDMAGTGVTWVHATVAP